MSQNTSTSASFVERIQTVFQEQVSSEYKRRSGIGSESDQQEWVNERYAQLNKAVNEMVTLPGTKPEFPDNGSRQEPEAKGLLTDKHNMFLRQAGSVDRKRVQSTVKSSRCLSLMFH